MFLGVKTDGTDLTLNTKTLATHVTVLGSTGSGKSGLILNIAEELQRADIPIILVDIKGDMVNLALQQEHSKVRCFTPGGRHGEYVNVLAKLKANNPEEGVTALLSLIGEDPDPWSSSAHLFLCELLKDARRPSLRYLVRACADPEIEMVGELPLNTAFPTRSRNALARKLNVLYMSSFFSYWNAGEEIDIDELVRGKHATIYSVAHLLKEEDQRFAISYLLKSVLEWMGKQSGSDEVRLVIGVDECLGLLPPTAKPPTKTPIMKLLKQGRAFGVGMVLGTQNPVDIDYKALSNCGMWCVGRMTAIRDRAKVSSAMSSMGGVAEQSISNAIAALEPRNFIAYTPTSLDVFRTRDTRSTLQGPMVSEEIITMYEEGYLTLPQKEYVSEYVMPEEEEEEVIEEEEMEEPIERDWAATLTKALHIGVWGWIALCCLSLGYTCLRK